MHILCKHERIKLGTKHSSGYYSTTRNQIAVYPIIVISIDIFIVYAGDGLAKPITPKAIRGPAFPVEIEFSCPPRPSSSAPAQMTMDRPITEWGPKILIFESSILIVATPESSAVRLPRSPSIFKAASSEGAPCVLPVCVVAVVEQSERTHQIK